MNVLASGTERGSSVEIVGSRDDITFIPRRRGRKTSTMLPIVRTPQAIPVTGISRPIEVKFASTESEWEQAFQLAASSYQARGYETPGASRLRFTPYHALPDTRTLVAKHEDEVVATFSIVQDNTLLGLPMEEIYQQEIDDLRSSGRRILEFITLADSGLKVSEFLPMFFTLIELGMQYHVSHGGDTFAMTVNPRHRKFYTKILGFLPLGPCRTYAAVQGHPAEAFWVDPKVMKANAPKMYETLFGSPLPMESFLAPRIPCRLIRQFSSDSSQCDPEMIEKIVTLTRERDSIRRW
ncbi:MAG TPA: hypothetical protein VMF69_19895 [Gemmataceae bacterium]|nr:hypothetical protein [Gemmataceae bacterium]